MNFLQSISLVTTFQLLQLSIVLFILQKGNVVSNRILGSFLLFNTLLMGGYSFGIQWIPGIRMDTFFYLLLAPYLFIYVKSLCSEGYKRSWKEVMHWIPAFIFLTGTLLFDVNDAIIQIGLELQIAIYVVFSFRIISKHRSDRREHFSSQARIDLSWLFLILITFAVMSSVDMISFLLIEFKVVNSVGLYSLSVVSISINLLFATSTVIIGLRHKNALSGYKDPPKYSKSGISSAKVKEYSSRIVSAMNEKQLYLNPELTIKELADEVDLHPKYLSQTINSTFKKTFFDFVNHYRVERAKEIMILDKSKTILEILYEVGYNSKSAFNKAFRKNANCTPTEFRNLQKMSTHS